MNYKLQFTLNPKIERKIKVGYEFTVTDAEHDYDNEYGYPSYSAYQDRKYKLKEKLRMQLTAYGLDPKNKSEFARQLLTMSPHTLVHNDPNVVEISAPPTASVRQNTRVLDLILTTANEFGFLPYRGQQCGGMHANVDIGYATRKPRKRKEFCETKIALKISAKLQKLRDVRDRIYGRFDRIYYGSNLCPKYGDKRVVKFRRFANILDEKISEKIYALRAKYDQLNKKYNNSSPLIKIRAQAVQHAKAINMILNMFPSVVWTFHAPNDDDSAEIRTRFETALTGKHIAARLDCSYQFVEFRCVGMIGTAEQLKHVDIFFRRIALLAHQNMHLGDENTKYPQDQKHFDRYSFKRAVHEFYHVCRLLHLNPEDYRWWLENHLQHRLNYTDEPHSKFRK